MNLYGCVYTPLFYSGSPVHQKSCFLKNLYKYPEIPKFLKIIMLFVNSFAVLTFFFRLKVLPHFHWAVKIWRCLFLFSSISHWMNVCFIQILHYTQPDDWDGSACNQLTCISGMYLCVFHRHRTKANIWD